MSKTSADERTLIKTQAQLETMRHAGRILARVQARLREAAQPGVSTLALDELAEQIIREAGATPSFKGYRGYPATICAQINDVVVHGIPRADEVLAEGDIFGVDLGVCFEEYHADGAFTMAIGETDEESRRLLEVTERARDLAVAQVRPGATIRDLARAVQEHVEAAGFSVVTALVGHGIGRSIHEPPQVPNFVERGNSEVYDFRLKPGMAVAIEPMVNAGRPEVYQERDGWTVRTADGSRSAHFEHTVAVTEDGHWILTTT
ncbi:MAG: type I methionyl aminopeptidase [Armatimonadetes bacterium]|nr:type I methionyl aminopeptidase [Armatimonadota bacterium]